MLLYRSDEMIITDRIVAVRGPASAQYRVDDLTFPRVVVHGPGPAAAVAVRVAAVVLTSAFSVWALFGGVGPEVFVGAALMVSSVVGGACLRVSPQRHELWALHRNAADVRLYHSVDAREFGRVRRALVRAFDCRRARHAEHGGWWEIES